MDSSAHRQKNHLALWIGIAVAVGICIIVAIIAIPTAFKQLLHTRTFRVVGNSMDPTLWEGDLITADTAFYLAHPIADGDIVVFRHNDKLLIKRVSALSGETIECKGGKLIRNGAVLAEPYLKSPDKPRDPSDTNFSPLTLPQGQIFVTGDWRSISTDSRDPDYGPVHVSDVLGKVVYVYSSNHPNQQGRSF
jgi:signal peptidase I